VQKSGQVWVPTPCRSNPWEMPENPDFGWLYVRSSGVALPPFPKTQGTSNNQHPTLNSQCLRELQSLDVRYWMLVVGCSPPSVQGFKARAPAFVEFSSHPMGRGCPPGRVRRRSTGTVSFHESGYLSLGSAERAARFQSCRLGLEAFQFPPNQGIPSDHSGISQSHSNPQKGDTSGSGVRTT
jgi:hypothetical protein